MDSLVAVAVSVCRFSFASVTIEGLSGRNLFIKLYLPYVLRTFLGLLVVYVISFVNPATFNIAQNLIQINFCIRLVRRFSIVY